MTEKVRRGHWDKPTGRTTTPDIEITVGGIAAKLRDAVAAGGDIMKFAGRTVRSLPELRHHVSEVFAQAGILILSSGIIIWLMQFVVGTMCATEASYTLKQIGAPIYSAVFNDVCGLREMSVYMWAYIFAAKVGCGLVAEIGSMRIAEEIDALEVLGIKSRSYLVGTRIVAAWICMPFLYIVGLGLMFISMHLVTVYQLGTVSSGGYSYMFWLFQNPYDLIAAMSKMVAMGTIIIFVGCYYGYTASGGSVGVGRNTAKSMMLNMVLIHVVGLLGTWFFWGSYPNMPIGN
ncbi:phospholipid/cholesterol/gamma-HCH transport system permease protein [Amycolatopsis marina]|uniref:Phospholipid/cholesterol/gamma-HCH transport system permease protein n=1 Tax=Amycolatopsis marina TaxID=490629 RepID=A0A1I1BUF0_9PSEU|nr:MULTISPECIES: ABC transporter permease [Amycolatopsis]SFB53452.1 phospholipid/cholesterol/gamma-HCH transport system permease protein [Amycolatopsis marina]